MGFLTTQKGQNRLVLSGQLLIQEPCRSSPTGHPVLECSIWHLSEQLEADSQRQLAFRLAAKAVGAVAQRLMKCHGQQLRFRGFVAPRRAARSSEDAQSSPAATMIFHITDFELENEDGVHEETV